jgi:eukaryotic-like serine/threonine-protein kinase
MKRFLLVLTLILTGCAPSQANLAATAKVAIEQTQTALPTKTLIPYTATAEQTSTPAPSATPALGIGSSRVRPQDSMTMLYVPEGEFTMGYSEGRLDERPTHSVYLDAFWIDKTEVTAGQYAFCAGAGKCRGSKLLQPSEDSPMVNVAWRDANAYCSYVGARLPTEAEWEKAARGTDGRIYPWGNDMDKSRLVQFTWDNKMPAVGGFPEGASPYGALDMAGGAFEWVSDWYLSSYYTESPDKNPQGPSSGEMHVIRGGWSEWCPSTYICHLNPTYSSTFRNGTGYYGRGGAGPAWVYYPGAGFRCAGGS